MKRPFLALGSSVSPAPRPSSLAAGGFTLVELLVVITIIGILAGLAVPAVIVARIYVKNAVIASELSQLDMALKMYKEKFGEYPPDFTDTNLTGPVGRHIAKAFPRYTDNWQTDIVAAMGVPDVSGLTPQMALVFWLGGVPTNGVPSGFAADPQHPFANATVCPSRISPFFEFDPNRLSNTTGSAPYRYWPQGAVGDRATGAGAIVYFRAENGTYAGKSVTNAGATIYPAVDTRLAGPPYVNPQSVQIFSAGLDVLYSAPTGGTTTYQFPSGANYDPTGHTFDDITNFSGGTLESAMP